MKGAPALAICFFSGLALSFAFPEPSVAPLAWFLIAPLLVLADREPRKGAAYGFAFGLGFFGSLLIWIKVVGWVAWLVLVLMEALYLGAFGVAWGWISHLNRRWWALTAPSLWVTFEVLRESAPVVGFPWGQLAQSQGVLPWLLQISQVGGGKTVSFVLVAVNAMVALSVLARGSVRWRWAGGAVASILILVPASFLIPRIDGGPSGLKSEPLRITMVQGNASPGVRVEDERARVRRHLELTRSLAGQDIDLVVWPESSVGIDPFLDDDVMSMVADAARAVDAPMIVGANLDDGPNHYKVTALAVDDSGEVTDVYEKTHLVPFGEYVPGRDALGWIPMLDQVPKDAIPGDDPHNLVIAADQEHEVAAVISFEGDFGHLVRDRIALGARVIVVATNTSTWERTWASAQHVAMSQVRAAETRVPVAHAALSGISAGVNSDGTVAGRTELYEEDTFVFETATATDVSIYARTGEWLPLLCLLVSIVALASSIRRRSTVPA